MSLHSLVNQVKKSFVYKVLGVVSSFILIKYLIQYLGVEQYGIWAVILTFLNLVLYFDLGISNGIKNKLVQSLACNNKLRGQEYISTGYILITCIATIVYLIFFIASFFIDWTGVFNSTLLDNSYLQKVILIVVFFTLVNLVFSIANTAYSALQSTQLITLNQFVSQALSLFCVILLINFYEQSLILVATVYGITLTLSTIIISTLFYNKNNFLKPSLQMFNKEKAKEVFSLGLKFLSLQLMFFFIQSNDRIIVSQLLDPISVTNYDIIYKYFSVLIILHTLINAPLWPLYTKAYQEKDYATFISIFKKLAWLVIGYILLGLIMLLFGKDIITLWISPQVSGQMSNFIYMFLMMLTLIIFSIFSYFSNGINKTNIQFYSVFVGSLINVPLSIYFVKFLGMGLDGVLLATIISLSVFCITGLVQCVFELKKLKEHSISDLDV